MRPIMLGLLATVMTLAAPIAAAEATVEFVNASTGVIDLDSPDIEVGDAWAVTVMDTRAERDTPVSALVDSGLAKALRITSVQVIEENPGGSATVAVVLELIEPHVTEGDLVLVAGGTSPVRRRIRVVRTGAVLLVPSEVTLQGVRPVPFVGSINVDPMTLGPGRRSEPPTIVGTVAAEGDTATVVLDGARLDVLEVDDVGTYKGTAALPQAGADGDAADVAVTVHARDAVGWPALALMVGLVGTGLLERWRRRERPRLVLEREINDLKRRAGAIRRDHEIRAHITREAADLPPLVLDEEALGARRRLEAGGEGSTIEDVLTPLEEVFSSYAEVADALSDAEVAYRRIISRARIDQRGLFEAVLNRGPLGRARAIDGIRTRQKLADAEREAIQAEEYVKAFEDCELLIRRVSAKAARGEDEQTAHQLMDRLLTGEEPADITAAAKDLDRRLAPRPPAPVPSPALTGVDTHEAANAAREAPADVRRGGSAFMPRWSAALVALGIVGGLSALVMTSMQANRINPTMEPVPSTTLAPAVPTPDLPPELPSAMVLRSDTPADDPDTSVLGWEGLILPLGLGLVITAVLWWLAHRVIGALGTSATKVGNSIKHADAIVGIVTGVIAVGSGLAILYAPNPGFGTTGDYAQALLWGTAVGEGVQIARRFIPGHLGT